MRSFFKFLKAGIRGIPIGITIGFIISLIITVSLKLPTYSPSSEVFDGHFANNTQAVIASAILWALMGFVTAMSSRIFVIESWSITKKTVVHFLVTYLVFTPLAILAGWFPLEINFLISYSLSFIIVYIIEWVIMMQAARARIDKLNKLINESHK